MKKYHYHMKNFMSIFFINYVNNINFKDKIKKNIWNKISTNIKILRTQLKFKINVMKKKMSLFYWVKDVFS